jgi:hypothetical protein
VRYLLDECLSDLTAKTMAVLGAPDEFVYILDVAGQSLDDLDIPALCQAEHFDILVTINVKDFGARKPIYEAVIDAGINVLVLRPKKGQPTNVHWQAGLLARHYPAYTKLFGTATEATLGSLSDGGVRQQTLTQIMAEIEADEAGKKALP